MKKEWLILVLLVLFVGLVSFTGLVSSSVQVHNITDFKTNYSKFEKISGKINLTISNENFTTGVRSSNGGRIFLGDFLENNSVSGFCTPPDCSQDYSYAPSVAARFYNKTNNNSIYTGFVVTGGNVEVTSLNFTILNVFGISETRPISIKFFEDYLWEYKKFSNELTEKNWGCYDPALSSQGPLLGDSISYCEIINLPETSTIRVGADISGGTQNLEMNVYTPSGTSVGRCYINMSSKECDINAQLGSVFSLGNYSVCIMSSSTTNYRLKKETSGTNCGFIYSEGSGNSDKDYSIFAKSAKYSNLSGVLPLENSVFNEAVISANKVITDKYKGNCSKGCVLPLEISGILQLLLIGNIRLDYKSSGELQRETNISDMNGIPAKVNFKGILDLSLTDFNVSEKGSYSIFLGDNKILEKNVNILPSPEIKSLSPLDPPAGVPVKFYVTVKNITNSTMSYEWDFGDSTAKEKTSENFVTHTYKDIKNYTITIKVTERNSIGTKSFEIKTVSPASAIDSIINKKRGYLNNVSSYFNKANFWYLETLEKSINLSYYTSELSRLNKSRNDANNNDSLLIPIAQELYALDVPASISVKSESGKGLFTETSNIDPSIISEMTEEDIEDEEIDLYREPILSWQEQNIQADVSEDILSVKYDNLEENEILRAYRISITSSSSDESYFVIDIPKESIYFRENIDTEDIQDSTIITLNPDETKNIEFYYSSPVQATFFVSPELSTLPLEGNIDTTCNSNGICDKDSGEDSDNCRIDCKPTSKIILYVVLVIVFILILYTFLQIWYKRHYENHLFGDRRHLYNLLMYVDNAYAQGHTDDDIKKALKKSGWSGERIVYVLNKSKGKSNGLYEIIPIDKISSYFRNKNKQKNTTNPQQQIMGNINKSDFQRPIR